MTTYLDPIAPLGAPINQVTAAGVPITTFGPSTSPLQPATTINTQITRSVPVQTYPPGEFQTVSKSSSYWNTPSNCHPGREWIKCPIILYIILIIIGIVINAWALFRTPRTDNSGKEVTTGQMWVAGIVGFGFYLIISLAVGWWIYERCKKCERSSYWMTFIIAILIAIILAPITGLIIGSILGVGFLWTANQEPNDF